MIRLKTVADDDDVEDDDNYDDDDKSDREWCINLNSLSGDGRVDQPWPEIYHPGSHSSSPGRQEVILPQLQQLRSRHKVVS